MRRIPFILTLILFVQLCWAQTIVPKRTEINIGGGQLTSPSFKTNTSLTATSTALLNATSFKTRIGVFPLRFNQDPTDIQLSSQDIDENQPVGTVVGLLTSTDPEINDLHSYALFDLPNYPDNDAFSIVGDELRSAIEFDFETKNSYTIRIQTDDGDGGGILGIYDKEFTITINNITPTDIELTAVAPDNYYPVFPENLPAGTTIADLATTDRDAISTEDDHIYSLVPGDGTDDADNDLFEIIQDTDGDRIVIKNDSLNFERPEGPDFNFRLRSEDLSAEFYEEAFTISVTDVDDPPRGLLEYTFSIAEDAPSGTEISTLTAVDDDILDSQDKFIYQISGPDAGKFAIDGRTFKSASTFDFATKSQYSLTLTIIDNWDQVNSVNWGNFDLQVIKTIQVFILSTGNSLPEDISLDKTDIPENLIIGNSISTISTTDPDTDDTFTYDLIDQDNYPDNQYFTIDADLLVLNTTLDISAKSSYDINIQTNDGKGGLFSKPFTLTVIPFVNSDPTDIQLSNTSIDQSITIGSAVGILSAADVDANESFTFSLVSGTGDTDNSSFSINGDELLTAQTFDFNVQNSFSIRIEVQDSYGGSYQESFIITITDSDAPQILTLSPENGSIGHPKSGNISITFDEPVTELTGDISIYEKATNQLFETISVPSAIVTGTGTSTIEINPTGTFIGNTEYYVTIDNGTWEDISGNQTTGWTNFSTWSFVTENAAPSDIALSASTVQETAASGTIVADLSATDEDPSEVFSFSLVAGTGDTDNASFIIEGNQLKTNTTFDYLLKNSYSVRIQVSDVRNATYEEVFQIDILDSRSPVLLTADPADGSVDINDGFTINIAFNETTAVGTGAFLIKEYSNDQQAEAIAVTSNAVTGFGTTSLSVQTSADLKGGVKFYITLETGAVTDLAGNPFPGWTDKDFLTFVTYDDENPEISFNGSTPDIFEEGATATLSVEVTDASPVSVTYHSGGFLDNDSELTSLTLTPESGIYSATVDASQFDDLGFRYFFRAEDVNGNISNTETKYIYLRQSTPTNISGLKFGGKVEDYQIIAVPYELDDKKVLTVFSALGNYDKKKWRLIKYRPESGQFVDFPSFTTIEIGEGYWFNMKDQNEIVLAGREFPQIPENGFALNLKVGWNQIGNPFTVPLDWNKVLEDNGITSEVEALWVYKGGASLVTGSSLDAFEGGFIKASSLITLNLLPGGGSGRFGRQNLAGQSLDNEYWAVPLMIENSRYTYESGYFGMHPEASEDHDRFDLSRPPHLINHFDYYFDKDQMAAEVVPTQSEYTWEFSVDSNLDPEFTTLRWDNSKFGENTSLLLFDVEKQHIIDMMELSEYGFHLSGKRDFRAYFNIPIDKIQPDLALLGEAYPNPFRKSTIIPVALPETINYELSLKVFNLMGSEVSTLYIGQYNKGFHSFEWDGTDHQGNQVNNGLYIVQMTINGSGVTKTFNSRIIKQ